MPIGPAHKAKYAKNWLLLAILLVLLAALYGVAFLRVQNSFTASAEAMKR